MAEPKQAQKYPQNRGNQYQARNESEIKYPVPQASSVAWQEYKYKPNQNPGLVFDRFVPRDALKDSNIKKRAWEDIIRATENADAVLLHNFISRWKAVANAAQAEIFPLQTDWRFIPGLGRKGPLEVGFTFHRYGFPMLPGSSVKGVARAWLLSYLVKKISKNSLDKLDEILSVGEEENYQSQVNAEYPNISSDIKLKFSHFRRIFGTTGNEGCAIFFDAIPAQKPILELDIMNPHYQNYYQGKDFPNDWDSPVPVNFLTVSKNTEFLFALGMRNSKNDDLQDLAKKCIVYGMTQLGAGAKTSAGYGYFKKGE